MSDRYLIDTNIISNSFRHDRAIIRRLAEVDYHVPTPVVGEIYHWAFYPTISRERLIRVRSFLIAVPIIDVDYTTGEKYGLISATLEAEGRRIPINDMWIAALALQHSMIVATRDSDFERIPGLKAEYW